MTRLYMSKVTGPDIGGKNLFSAESLIRVYPSLESIKPGYLKEKEPVFKTSSAAGSFERRIRK